MKENANYEPIPKPKPYLTSQSKIQNSALTLKKSWKSYLI